MAYFIFNIINVANSLIFPNYPLFNFRFSDTYCFNYPLRLPLTQGES